MKHSLKYPHFSQHNQREAPLLTTNILDYTEERTLDELLEKVYFVEPPPKEILVVDDYSTDSSRDILEK